MTTAVLKNIRLVFPFWIIDKLSVSFLHEILEQKMLKGSASNANKDCQTLFNVNVFHKTPKSSFLPHISENDGKQGPVVQKSISTNPELNI